MSIRVMWTLHMVMWIYIIHSSSYIMHLHILLSSSYHMQTLQRFAEQKHVKVAQNLCNLNKIQNNHLYLSMQGQDVHHEHVTSL